MKTRPKIAFFDFAGCEGCQLTVIDSLQKHPHLLDAVEIVQFREAMSEMDDNYSIAFIEGSCTRQSDVKRLQDIRDQASIVVALGACAHLGGVNAIRNLQPSEHVHGRVYGDSSKVFETGMAKPISDVIPIDGFIPGCPIEAEEFIRSVIALLQGNRPSIADYPLCIECKMREYSCLYHQNQVCLGPITRGGCGALCPSFGVGCNGCRGLISNPNISSLAMVMTEHGQSHETFHARMSFFLTNQVFESEVADVEI